MPKEIEFEKRIPTLYRRKALDLALYFYARGILDTLPSVQVKQAVAQFLRVHCISEDDLSLDYALQIYYKVKDDEKKF